MRRDTEKGRKRGASSRKKRTAVTKTSASPRPGMRHNAVPLAQFAESASSRMASWMKMKLQIALNGVEKEIAELSCTLRKQKNLADALRRSVGQRERYNVDVTADAAQSMPSGGS